MATPVCNRDTCFQFESDANVCAIERSQEEGFVYSYNKYIDSWDGYQYSEEFCLVELTNCYDGAKFDSWFFGNAETSKRYAEALTKITGTQHAAVLTQNNTIRSDFFKVIKVIK